MRFLFIIVLILIFDFLQAQVETTVKVDSIPGNRSSNVYVNVDKVAEFPGGRDSLNIFYMENSEYTICSKSKNCRTIYYNIIIDSLGYPDKFRIIQGINDKYNKESERLVNIMPQWNPAIKNGKAVNALVTLSVSFNIKEE